MMIPTTYAVALGLTVLTMLCWGSWANTMKMSGKWRFELFYFDYSIGLFLAALIAAMTFGSYEMGTVADTGSPTFSFLDNMSIGSRTSMAYAVGGGIIFNLANLLLVAAIAIAGLSVAFPVGIGIALIVGTILNYVIKPSGSPTLLFGGASVILVAIIVTAMAQRAYATAKARAEVAAAPVAAGNRAVLSRRRASPAKGIVISVVSGILMGLFYPLVEMSKRGDLGMGPYAAGFCFAVGVLLSTPVFNLFFMNLPVEGEPVSFKDYFSGTKRQHLLGLLGGMIWSVGMVSNFVASSAAKTATVGPAVSYAIGQGATLVSMLWGLLLWKEFAGADSRVRTLIVLMLVLFVAGLAMLSVAPLY